MRGVSLQNNFWNREFHFFYLTPSPIYPINNPVMAKSMTPVWSPVLIGADNKRHIFMSAIFVYHAPVYLGSMGELFGVAGSY